MQHLHPLPIPALAVSLQDSRNISTHPSLRPTATSNPSNTPGDGKQVSRNLDWSHPPMFGLTLPISRSGYEMPDRTSFPLHFEHTGLCLQKGPHCRVWSKMLQVYFLPRLMLFEGCRIGNPVLVELGSKNRLWYCAAISYPPLCPGWPRGTWGVDSSWTPFCILGKAVFRAKWNRVTGIHGYITRNLCRKSFIFPLLSIQQYKW